MLDEFWMIFHDRWIDLLERIESGMNRSSRIDREIDQVGWIESEMIIWEVKRADKCMSGRAGG